MQIKRIFKDILFAICVLVAFCMVGIFAVMYRYDLFSLFPNKVEHIRLKGMTSRTVRLDVDNDQSDCIEVRVDNLNKVMNAQIEVRSVEQNKILYSKRFAASYENGRTVFDYNGNFASFYIQPEIKEVEISIISTLKESNVKVEIVSLDHCIN